MDALRRLCIWADVRSLFRTSQSKDGTHAGGVRIRLRRLHEPINFKIPDPFNERALAIYHRSCGINFTARAVCVRILLLLEILRRRARLKICRDDPR
nr:hypothetical protein [uncultured Campylobacter sp.]